MAARANHAVLALCVMAASPVAAQTPPGPIVSGMVGAAALDSNTSLSFAGSAGYRFNSVFGMGIELTSAPMLESDPRFSPALSSVSPTSFDYRDQEGSLTIFTTNVRLDIPTTTRRVVPYAVAGGGLAHLEERFLIRYVFTRPALPGVVFPDVIEPYPEPIPVPFSSSSLAMALTLGAGVSILATDRFSIDADLRYFSLKGERDRNVGRFGVGASYRF